VQHGYRKELRYFLEEHLPQDQNVQYRLPEIMEIIGKCKKSVNMKNNEMRRDGYYYPGL
jgi:hypothetical protein